MMDVLKDESQEMQMKYCLTKGRKIQDRQFRLAHLYTNVTVYLSNTLDNIKYYLEITDCHKSNGLPKLTCISPSS